MTTRRALAALVMGLAGCFYVPPPQQAPRQIPYAPMGAPQGYAQDSAWSTRAAFLGVDTGNARLGSRTLSQFSPDRSDGTENSAAVIIGVMQALSAMTGPNRDEVKEGVEALGLRYQLLTEPPADPGPYNVLIEGGLYFWERDSGAATYQLVIDCQFMMGVRVLSTGQWQVFRSPVVHVDSVGRLISDQEIQAAAGPMAQARAQVIQEALTWLSTQGLQGTPR